MSTPESLAAVAIRQYVEDWIRLRDGLLEWCTETVAPVRSTRDVLQLVWDGVLPRRGVFGGDDEYLVHGRIGCRITTAGGMSVDSDVVGGLETFDAGRVTSYARSSMPPSDPPAEAIRVALQELEAEGHLVAVDDRSYVIPASWP